MENEPLDLAIFGTSRTFEEQLNDPKNPNVYCLFRMDGKEFILKNSYNTELHQKTADHDTFSIIVPDDALDSFQGYVLENSKNILGNEITINFHQWGKIQQSFTGIIGGIDNAKNEGGGYGNLIISGFSPSILLETGKDCQSFEEKTLEQIIQKVCEIYPREGKIKVSYPRTKHVFPYTVQYQESDYQFIRRLAMRHGEFFYYNGQELVFGAETQPTLKLREDNELMDVTFSMKMGAQEFGWVGYDAHGGAKIERDAKSEQSEFKANLFQTVAVNRSKNVFRKKPKMHFNHLGTSRNADFELKKALLLEKEKREDLMHIKGRSYNPAVRMGGRVELSDINGKAMETYRIIEIKHIHDPGEYYNEFTAIPDLFYAAPFIDTEALPKGEEQSARVTDNDDPLGMGRVRVQFPWQEDKGQKTPWIRLIQPHSGAGKGFHFIPEIGEEVLVGFEGRNAEKPFVLGTHYNGKEMSGFHTPNNDLKVNRTRSGIESRANDAEGSYKRSTPDGNFLHFDGQGNATLNVPKDLLIQVGGNLSIQVGENQTINVSLNSTETVGMNKTTSVGMMKMLNVGKDFMTNVVGKLIHFIKGDMETFGEKEHRITTLKGVEVNSQENIKNHSEKEIKNNSGEKTKLY